jgi:hypothetical protein
MYKLTAKIGLVGLMVLGCVGASPLQARSSVNVTNPAYNKTLTEELELAATVCIYYLLNISQMLGRFSINAPQLMGHSLNMPILTPTRSRTASQSSKPQALQTPTSNTISTLP